MRSLLYVPGNRLELLDKVGRSGPDVVVIDLEDAIPADRKDGARAAVSDILWSGRPKFAGRLLVRVNAAGTPAHEADVTMCGRIIDRGDLDGVVLPKYEHIEQLTRLQEALPSGAHVMVGLESALGVADARPLLAAGPQSAYFGAEDFIADLGGRRTSGGQEVLYARSAVVLAAAVAGVDAVDQAVVAIRDIDAFRRDAEQGRDLGYGGKICLHPDQVVIAAEVFTPSTDEILHARAVLAAAAHGVGLVDGVMVDAVHERIARGVLARAGESA